MMKPVEHVRAAIQVLQDVAVTHRAEACRPFRRNDGSVLAELIVAGERTPTFVVGFRSDATDRERELFREYLSDCFEDAARAVADCVEQGIRGVGR